MHEAAQAIAKQIYTVTEDVHVVYSSDEPQDLPGCGRWTKVSQDKYFGKKFAVLLDNLEPGRALLLIQADAQCDNWDEVFLRCQQVMSNDADIGIWSPHIDNTPFPNAVVMQTARGDGLLEVLQTDAIVLGLNASVVDRLRIYDFQHNNLGWGIDWAAISYARAHNLAVVRDLTSAVHHPPSRGYDSSVAQEQMEQFLDQLTPDERRCYTSDYSRVSLNKSIIEGECHSSIISSFLRPGLETSSCQKTWAELCKHVHFLYLQKGRILVSPVDSAAKVSVSFGPDRVEEITQTSHDPLPIVLDVDLSTYNGVSVGYVNGEKWSCLGQSTLRHVFSPETPTTRLPLIVPFDLADDLGDVYLLMGAAIHRAYADILVEWQDEYDLDVGGETWIKLDPGFNGREEFGDYQAIKVRIPRSGARRTIRISLCFWSSRSQGTEPAVVFTTRPILKAMCDAESASSALLVVGSAVGDQQAPRLDLSFDTDAEELTLHIGEHNFILLSRPEAQVQLTLQQEKLVVTSNKRCRGTLQINGRVTRALCATPEASPLNLQVGLLDDSNTICEIRDPTGNVTYARFSVTAE
jgi:hypothetical protein